MKRMLEISTKAGPGAFIVQRFSGREELGRLYEYQLELLSERGDITSDQKRELQSIFQSEFEISRDEAADLLLASSHLIRDEIYIVDHLDKILEPSAAKFEPSAVSSLLSMMRRIAALDGSINGEQQRLIDATERYFASRQKAAGGKWS